MKQTYELMVIMRGDVTDKEIDTSVSGLRKMLPEITYEEVWGMRPFAYPIKGQDKGYYVVWNFAGSAEQAKELEENMKLYPNLVRHLLMKVPENYTPTTLKELEAGLEEWRQKKAEKRGTVRNAMQKRAAKAKEASEDVPAPTAPKKDAPKKDTKEEKGDGEKESLDSKLNDILTDSDLGL